MVRSNITVADFSGGVRNITTAERWQFDYGQLLSFSGIELPATFECQFSNIERGAAVTQIGSNNTVTIPDAMFLRGAPIYAWVFLHTGADDGETEYMAVIPIIKRAQPSDTPPTPVEQSVITQAIAALNAAVEQTNADVIAAEAAQAAAELAQGKAEDAQTAAELAQDKAEDAQEAAETAQGKAEDAQTAAETAQGKAEDAQSAAEAAEADVEANALKAEGYAVGQQNGSDVVSGSPYYHNNAKYYKEQAACSAAAAGISQTAAELAQGKAEDAQEAAEIAQGKAEDAQAAVESALIEKADVIISSASGPIASFADGAEMPAKSLIVDVKPIQDLHGYDKPWPAGGGKNLLDPNLKFTAGTYYGGFVLDTTDGYNLTLSGTPTESGNVQTNSIPTADAVVYPAGTYTSTGAIFSTYKPDGSWYTNRLVGTWTADSDFIIRAAYIQAVANVPGSGTRFISLAKGSTALSGWEPYSNVCPITGRTGLELYVSPTQDQQDATTYTEDWSATAGTVYGGSDDVVSGALSSTMANIASYNGETIGEPWLSSLDEYSPGATPTTGAQVVYTLSAPITYQLTPQEVEMLFGQNNVWSDSGDVSIQYRADTKLYINQIIAQAIAQALNA